MGYNGKVANQQAEKDIDFIGCARGGMADTPDLGSGSARSGGSSPLARTMSTFAGAQSPTFSMNYLRKEAARCRRQFVEQPRSQGNKENRL